MPPHPGCGRREGARHDGAGERERRRRRRDTRTAAGSRQGAAPQRSRPGCMADPSRCGGAGSPGLRASVPAGLEPRGAASLAASTAWRNSIMGPAEVWAGGAGGAPRWRASARLQGQGRQSASVPPATRTRSSVRALARVVHKCKRTGAAAAAGWQAGLRAASPGDPAMGQSAAHASV